MRWILLHEKDGSEHLVNIAGICDIARWKMDNETTICRIDGPYFECVEDYDTVSRAVWEGSRYDSCLIIIDGKSFTINSHSLNGPLAFKC